MAEVWREVQGYEGIYWVSNLGRIKSKRVIRVLYLNPNGYLTINLSKNGEHKTHYVHVLVCSAFNGEKEGILQVNHINEIKTDNRAFNLKWETPKKNANHGKRNKMMANSKRGKKRVYDQSGQFTYK